MNSFVLDFKDIDKEKISIAGGKGANLGELSRIEGIQVPEGFCISTAAFQTIIGETPPVTPLLEQLSVLKVEDREKIGELSRKIRTIIEAAPIPGEIYEATIQQIEQHGEKNAYAIRSSATAEDLPTTSFAGQQDTYLNIIGRKAILQHITKCWASLFTERAIVYRMQNGFDHRKVYLSVIVQKMVFPQAAGILFTADPVTSNRKVVSIDASFGLGEALVSGLVNADIYKVRKGTIVEKKIADKKMAIYALKEGGTKQQEIEQEQQHIQTLTDEQILQLEQIGRKIESHFGYPQDIEWCLADNRFYIVQSRPITTLYPIPEANDHENHVYVSVGHQQMMTDAMKPLGLSFFNLNAGRTMYQAGGRLFVDVAPMLATAAGRQTLIGTLGQSDPLIKDALTTIVERGDFVRSLPDDAGGKSNKVISTAGFRTQVKNDPAIVADLINTSEASVAALQQEIQHKSGSELFDFILEDIGQRKRVSESKSLPFILAAMDASFWINKKMKEWLGEKNVADTLTQSVPNNITSEMGLALLEVADVIRPYPEVVSFLQHTKDDNFLDEISKFNGGKESRDAILAFLDKYGMRCVGEVDITKPRWNEKPTTLLPLILGNVRNFEPGASKRRFEQGKQEALKKEQELLDRLSLLPGGDEKAAEAKQMISLVRNFAGYREYPKYEIVSRLFIYKQALLKEAEKLDVLRDKEDIYYLSFEELQEAIRTKNVDHHLIARRKEEYKSYQKLTPPRVITSDGEIVTGNYKREGLPAGAIVGLPVSAGIAEGRARVILHLEDADLGAEDILVTRFTDPSWTPLFVSIKGLVAEVGGLMTHGAVIAREYGLPAVVGVENATQLIKDGQRIRVHGAEGYVEIL